LVVKKKNLPLVNKKKYYSTKMVGTTGIGSFESRSTLPTALTTV
jgi:hypothetical protein